MISVKTLKGILGCLAAGVVLAGCSSAYKPMEVYTSVISKSNASA